MSMGFFSYKACDERFEIRPLKKLSVIFLIQDLVLVSRYHTNIEQNKNVIQYSISASYMGMPFRTPKIADIICLLLYRALLTTPLTNSIIFYKY